MSEKPPSEDEDLHTEAGLLAQIKRLVREKGYGGAIVYLEERNISVPNSTGRILMLDKQGELSCPVETSEAPANEIVLPEADNTITLPETILPSEDRLQAQQSS